MSAIEVGRANFTAVVLEGSKERPVLVDFWAPWCAPCRALAPILERVAADYSERLTLAKLDTDREPELAAQHGIRGIPCCKLFVDGRMADEFTGVLPEAKLRAFLDVALPSPAAPLIAEARERLAAGDAATALARLDAALAVDPGDEDALLTQAEGLLALSRAHDAASVLAKLEAPQRNRERPVRDARRLAALKARAALADDGGGPDLAALRARVTAAPGDCAARLAFARAAAASRDYDTALDQLLAIVQADRSFGDDVGRKTMLTIFEALGNDSDLVRRYRRELASAINR